MGWCDYVRSCSGEEVRVLLECNNRCEECGVDYQCFSYCCFQMLIVGSIVTVLEI